ncbi:hypothetical protein GCM10011413_29260 [Pedobacter psychrotolerans]|uniref:Uncharacterized protein n=1 Tax=Pedobacter psychrotolerans TaxID=1843235 RepID=A0ABQ1SUQ7_9SPHI|nr:hypothetical protein GCM10011413_29260 [Pedobacter psychrotolerans]
MTIIKAKKICKLDENKFTKLADDLSNEIASCLAMTVQFDLRNDFFQITLYWRTSAN